MLSISRVASSKSISTLPTHAVQEDTIECIRELADRLHEIPPELPPPSLPNNATLSKVASHTSLIIVIAWSILVFVTEGGASVFGERQDFGRVLLSIAYALLTFGIVLWNVYFAVGTLIRAFTPIKYLKENSACLSVKPEECPIGSYPDVTVQVPVYKEAFEVLRPTLDSCLESCNYYRNNARAEARILVSDDGILPLLDDSHEEAERIWRDGETTSDDARVQEVVHRMQYYREHGIGVVCRPSSNRAGKFKKASNLNFTINVSNEIEYLQKTAKCSYDEALRSSTQAATRGRFFAANGVEISPIIVLNDSDSRMAPDVIFRTAPIFINNPEVAFTQHATKTLDEHRGISSFTRILSYYTDALYQIFFLISSANGVLPPLVGHSTFLRKSALHRAGHRGPAGTVEYWSESHISEDFELMIRLYIMGYTGKYVAFPDSEFQEGITFNYDEEARKLRKFSSGAHELIFNPMSCWLSSSVLSKKYHNFILSPLPRFYKIHLISYLGSYFSSGFFVIFVSIAFVARLAGSDAGYFNVNPVAVIALNAALFVGVGVVAFAITNFRIRNKAPELLFREYREMCVLGQMWASTWRQALYQTLFFGAGAAHVILGGLDHIFNLNTSFNVTNKTNFVCGSRMKRVISIFRNNAIAWLIQLTTMCLSIAAFLVGRLSLIFAVVPLAIMLTVSITVPFIFHPGLIVANK